MFKFSHFEKIDWILTVSVFLISVFGLLEIFGMVKNGVISNFLFYKQIISLVLGFFVMFFLAFFFDYRYLKSNSASVLFLYLIALSLLIFVWIRGENIRGSSSWINLGFFSIEPIEFVKVACIILFAKFFSQRHVEIKRIGVILISFLYLTPILFLLLLLPDLGGSIAVLSIWFFILLASGIPKKYIIFLLLIGVLVASVGWISFLKEYQKQRIISFLNPYEDPRGSGYNVIQSMIAVGNGGWFGKGLGQGSQVQLGFLPESHTDFIFASVAEEFGFFGILILLFLVSLVAFRVLNVAYIVNNNFGKLFAIGFLGWFLSQILVNAGMNMGIMPITGITFPFLSYGGSSLLALFVSLGILQSIKLRS